MPLKDVIRGVSVEVGEARSFAPAPGPAFVFKSEAAEVCGRSRRAYLDVRTYRYGYRLRPELTLRANDDAQRMNGAVRCE